jgi:hypothetical protein
MSLGDSLEIGIPLAFFPVGTASDTISDAGNSYNLSESFVLSAFSAGLNIRYFLMKGDFRPFVAAGGLVMPISIGYSFSEIYTGYSSVGTGSFSGMAIGGQAQIGLDWHLGETFIVSPFVGYQVASAGLFTGNLSGMTNGTAISGPGSLQMEPIGTLGEGISAATDGYALPAGSHPLQMDLGGIQAGVQISAFF